MKPIFYISGMMQGSQNGLRIHDQRYRIEIKTAIKTFFPESKIVCPFEIFSSRKNIFSKNIEKEFTKMVELAGQADVVISFIPEASMGSAVEIWTAHNKGRIVIAISKMKNNWLLISGADIIIPSIKALYNLFKNGWLEKKLQRNKTL